MNAHGTRAGMNIYLQGAHIYSVFHILLGDRTPLVQSASNAPDVDTASPERIQRLEIQLTDFLAIEMPPPPSPPSTTPELMIIDLPSSDLQNKSMMLSKSQEAVLEIVDQGESVFFTGSAGVYTLCRSMELTQACLFHRYRKVRSVAQNNTAMS